MSWTGTPPKTPLYSLSHCRPKCEEHTSLSYIRAGVEIRGFPARSRPLVIAKRIQSKFYLELEAQRNTCLNLFPNLCPKLSQPCVLLYDHTVVTTYLISYPMSDSTSYLMLLLRHILCRNLCYDIGYDVPSPTLCAKLDPTLCHTPCPTEWALPYVITRTHRGI